MFEPISQQLTESKDPGLLLSQMSQMEEPWVAEGRQSVRQN
jgi:hypothetical protein